PRDDSGRNGPKPRLYLDSRGIGEDAAVREDDGRHDLHPVVDLLDQGRATRVALDVDDLVSHVEPVELVLESAARAAPRTAVDRDASGHVRVSSSGARLDL